MLGILISRSSLPVNSFFLSKALHPLDPFLNTGIMGLEAARKGRVLKGGNAMGFREPTILGGTGLRVCPLGVASSYGAPAEAFAEAFERGLNYFSDFRATTVCSSPEGTGSGPPERGRTGTHQANRGPRPRQVPTAGFCLGGVEWIDMAEETEGFLLLKGRPSHCSF
jgi:hypothetical protein